MHKVLTHLLLVCVMGITIAFVDRAPAAAYDVYYLSIGNSHYRDTTLDFPDANLIAHEVAENLRRAGAVDGLTLVSEQAKYMTRDDVLGALNEIGNKAKAARNPLIIYYFLGHGGSGRDGSSHVSFLGNYKSSDPHNATRSSAIVATQEVRASFEKWDVPYILILDNCYYREPAAGVLLLGRRVAGMYIEAEEILARIGKRDPAIILYAAKPGHSVPALPHPWDKDMASGPLARRLLLLFKATSESRKDLTVGEFLQKVNDPAFDPKSVPGDHKAWIGGSGSTLLISAGARP